MTNDMNAVLSALDGLVDTSTDMGLSPHALIEMHADIAAWSYRLAEITARKEEAVSILDDRYRTLEAKSVLSRMAVEKMAKNKAEAEVMSDGAMESLRQEAIRAKTDYRICQLKMKKSEDVFTALTVRIGRANKEMQMSQQARTP